jgi:hypothetical protein
MKCKNCNNHAEWLDQYCQMCWEEYCSEQWWSVMSNLEIPRQKEEVA